MGNRWKSLITSHGGAGWRSGGKGSSLRGWEPVPPYAEVIHSKQQSQDFWNRTCNILVFAAVLLSLRDSREQRGNGKTPPQEGPRHRTRGTDQVEAAMQRTGQQADIRGSGKGQRQEAGAPEARAPGQPPAPCFTRALHLRGCRCSLLSTALLFSTGTGSRTTSSRISPLIHSRHFIPLSQVGGFHAALFCAG